MKNLWTLLSSYTKGLTSHRPSRGKSGAGPQGFRVVGFLHTVHAGGRRGDGQRVGVRGQELCGPAIV